MKRYCLALDLKDDPELIESYKTYHQPGNVWPEVIESIRDSGIHDMEIFLTGHRLFMIMEVDDSFDFATKARRDAADPKVQAWEALMWIFQEALPWAEEGEKWVQMTAIFQLQEHLE